VSARRRRAGRLLAVVLLGWAVLAAVQVAAWTGGR
jgi:hypothetical protein